MKSFIVNSFTEYLGEGNPAGVILLDREIDDNLMLTIAKDIGKSETAFIYNNTIRWFTPEKEMPICGHATLAAVKVLSETTSRKSFSLDYAGGRIESSINESGWISLSFPIDPFTVVEPESYLMNALNLTSVKEAIYGEKTGKLVFILDSDFELESIKPDFNSLLKYRGKYCNGVGVSHTGSYDSITRYFNPWAGVNEDFVTGSVHTLLFSYWSEKLNKKALTCYQASSRPGIIEMRGLSRDKVELKGKCKIVIKGEIVWDLQ